MFEGSPQGKPSTGPDSGPPCLLPMHAGDDHLDRLLLKPRLPTEKWEVEMYSKRPLQPAGHGKADIQLVQGSCANTSTNPHSGKDSNLYIHRYLFLPMHMHISQEGCEHNSPNQACSVNVHPEQKRVEQNSDWSLVVSRVQTNVTSRNRWYSCTQNQRCWNQCLFHRLRSSCLTRNQKCESLSWAPRGKLNRASIDHP